MSKMAAILLSLTMGSIACVPKIDDNLALVSKPRLLAVKVSPAEVAPASSVSLQSLVAAPDGAHIPEISWSLCVARKPLTELGPVNPACLDPEADTNIVEPIGQRDSTSTSISSDACQLFGPVLPPPSEGQPSGRPVDPDQTGGYYQPLVAYLANGERSLGQVRLLCGPPSGTSREQLIKFNEDYRPNENPEISSLEMRLTQGLIEVPSEDSIATPLTVSAGAKIMLRTTWAACPRSSACGDQFCTAGETRENCPGDCSEPHGCTGAESYAALDDSRQVLVRREGIVVSWYATGGTFDNRRTGVSETDPDVPMTDNTWTAPTTSESVHLWLVLRDDRGGTSWQTYRLQVQ